MRPTVFQKAELRDENDNIVQQGTYGKGSALSNSTNDAWIDYVMNNLEALRSMSVGAVIPVETLPESGETGKAYVVTTGTDAGKLFMWDGEDWVEITGSIGDYLPITGGTITGNLTVEGISTAVTPAVDDNSTKVATTEYVQNEVKPIETDVDIADKRISNIEKLLQGNLYDYQTDSSSAYTKSVPSGAMPYAGLEQIGGKTVVWNQLFEPRSGTFGDAGVTFTNTNGLITTSGVATADGWVQVGVFRQNDNSAVGDKLLFTMTPSGTADTFYVNVAKPYWTSVYDNLLFTKTADTSEQAIRFYFKSGTDMNGKRFAFTGVNLTKMFGSGNEPSTVAEFEAMFPASYYTYNEGTLLSAGVTEVISKDTNNSTLQTYSIPASIQALEGYGWSAGSVYNYIDFERKVFVKNVARAVLDGTNTGVNGVSAIENNYRFNTPAILTGINYQGANSNIVSAPIPTKYDTINNPGGATENCLFPYSDKKIYITMIGNSISTTSAMNTWLQNNPVTVYYELAEPVEVDISEYLTDDNLINVESGGTLTFPNQNGTDYQIPVPSEETYMIDLQSAIGG